jgi:hypothetical protein
MATGSRGCLSSGWHITLSPHTSTHRQQQRSSPGAAISASSAGEQRGSAHTLLERQHAVAGEHSWSARLCTFAGVAHVWEFTTSVCVFVFRAAGYTLPPVATARLHPPLILHCAGGHHGCLASSTHAGPGRAALGLGMGGAGSCIATHCCFCCGCTLPSSVISMMCTAGREGGGSQLLMLL